MISTLNVSMAKTKLDAKPKENTSAKASSTPRRRSTAPTRTSTRSSTPTTPAGRSSPTERSGATAHLPVQMGKTKRSAIFLLRLSNTLSVSYSFFSPHHFKHFFQLLLFWFCCWYPWGLHQCWGRFSTKKSRTWSLTMLRSPVKILKSWPDPTLNWSLR